MEQPIILKIDLTMLHFSLQCNDDNDTYKVWVTPFDFFRFSLTLHLLVHINYTS